MKESGKQHRRKVAVLKQVKVVKVQESKGLSNFLFPSRAER
jgi:hypothetical protein